MSPTFWANWIGLQLGHGDEAVETVYYWDGNAWIPLLQLGHGDEAVETAAMLEKRTSRLEQLQLGHGDEAVETHGRL